MADNPPLIAHIVAHFAVGGLENGMVNLLNQIPPTRYRHAVISLGGYTEYAQRVVNPAVKFYALNKQPGKDLAVHWRLAKLLRQLKPAIVHTRNLSALECQFVAAATGIRARVHGEHGRDVFDLHGQNRKYNLLRKAARPLVTRYIAVSKDLACWLSDTVGVDSARITQIYNGVNIDRFKPHEGSRVRLGPPGFMRGSEFVIGSVGRMAEVKDFPTLIRAFVKLVKLVPNGRERLRLVIVGDGPTRAQCEELVRAKKAEHLIWLAGESEDVPEMLRAFDLFALPSLGEGISNTILEAMASGLPVIATHVGGNPELVEEGVTGMLVPPAQPDAMAQALLKYLENPVRIDIQGRTARLRAETRFSLEAMARDYMGVYDEVLGRG